MHTNIIYGSLIVAGAAAGFAMNRPLHLRSLRIFQMVLLPLLLCCLFTAGFGMATGALHKIIGVPLLLTASAGLMLTLAPNLNWCLQCRYGSFTPRERKPILLEDLHMQPIRQLIEAEKYQEACSRFESLLGTHRPDFYQLILLAQLYHQLKKIKQAEKVALQMISLAHQDSEQLTAMHFYHEVAASRQSAAKKEPASKGESSQKNQPEGKSEPATKS